jgi:hypothetical protein
LESVWFLDKVLVLSYVKEASHNRRIGTFHWGANSEADFLSTYKNFVALFPRKSQLSSLERATAEEIIVWDSWSGILRSSEEGAGLHHSSGRIGRCV